MSLADSILQTASIARCVSVAVTATNQNAPSLGGKVQSSISTSNEGLRVRQRSWLSVRALKDRDDVGRPAQLDAVLRFIRDPLLDGTGWEKVGKRELLHDHARTRNDLPVRISHCEGE